MPIAPVLTKHMKKEVAVYGKVPKKLWKTDTYFIAKLQRPIMGDPQVLVYDESRKWDMYMPLYPELLEWFGDEFKVYASVCITKDGNLHIDKIVEERAW